MRKDEIILANPVVDDVEAVFDGISRSGSDTLYDLPVGSPIFNAMYSHFKGAIKCQDHMIFSHTNVKDEKHPLPNGHGFYFYTNTPGKKNKKVKHVQYSEPPTWCHPGGMQTCGSFMVVGIQKAVKKESHSMIQIYDARNAQHNKDMKLIGEISRSEGEFVQHLDDGTTKTLKRKGSIQSAGMTRRLTSDGNASYIISANSGKQVTFYESESSTLLCGDGATTKFNELFCWEITKARKCICVDSSGKECDCECAEESEGEDNVNCLCKDKDGNKCDCECVYPPREGKTSLIAGSLVTQKMKDGEPAERVFFLGFDAKDEKKNMLKLYELDFDKKIMVFIKEKKMNKGHSTATFRYGKGISVESENRIDVYATSRGLLGGTIRLRVWKG